MRVSILPLLLAGATIVGLVAAEPIRVIENASSESANIRLGHALANANVNSNDDNVARIVRPMVLVNPPIPIKEQGRHSCGGLRDKAISFSNVIRHALGMPLIEAHLEAPRPNEIHILPVSYPHHNIVLDTSEETFGEGKPRKHSSDDDEGDDDHHHKHRGGHKHHHKHHKHHRSFLRRIHRAIRTLGPWEGRAVAFVLGCGIGVLLRMFWVLSVLTYRTVRGEREEIFDREYIVYEQVPETMFVSPPQYVEKVREDSAEDSAEEPK